MYFNIIEIEVYSYTILGEYVNMADGGLFLSSVAFIWREDCIMTQLSVHTSFIAWRRFKQPLSILSIKWALLTRQMKASLLKTVPVLKYLKA